MTLSLRYINIFSWSMNCHKELSWLCMVNRVFKLCIHRHDKTFWKQLQNTVWWRHSDVITFKCNSLKPKDRACPNDQFLKGFIRFGLKLRLSEALSDYFCTVKSKPGLMGQWMRVLNHEYFAYLDAHFCYQLINLLLYISSLRRQETFSRWLMHHC